MLTGPLSPTTTAAAAAPGLAISPAHTAPRISCLEEDGELISEDEHESVQALSEARPGQPRQDWAGHHRETSGLQPTCQTTAGVELESGKFRQDETACCDPGSRCGELAQDSRPSFTNTRGVGANIKLDTLVPPPLPPPYSTGTALDSKLIPADPKDYAHYPKEVKLDLGIHVTDMLTSNWFPTLPTSLDSVPLHDNTVEAMKNLCTFSQFSLAGVQYHLYEDGTGGSRQAGEDATAWACAVFVATTSDPNTIYGYGGCFAGLVHLDPSSPYYLGAEAKTNGSAEVTATTWALVWILWHAHTYCGAAASYTLHYDSTYSYGVVFSRYYCNVHKLLVQIGSTLAHMAQGSAHTAARHVKAHSGHPWNELADSICSFVGEWRVLGEFKPMDVESLLANSITSPVVPTYPWTQQPHLMKWAFIPLMPPEVQWQYPPSKEEEGVLIASTDHPLRTSHLPADLCAEHFDRYQEGGQNDDAKAKLIQWLLIQVNANSLGNLGVRASYERQIRKLKAIITGLQETRVRWSGKKQCGDFVVVAGEAVRGQFGTEIWFLTTVPIGYKNGQPIFITFDSVMVCATRPRMVLAQCTTPLCMFCVMSSHAPLPVPRTSSLHTGVR